MLSHLPSLGGASAGLPTPNLTTSMRLNRSQLRDVKNILAVTFEPYITAKNVRDSKKRGGNKYGEAWEGADIPGRERINDATRSISRLIGSIEANARYECIDDKCAVYTLRDIQTLAEVGDPYCDCGNEMRFVGIE